MKPIHRQRLARLALALLDAHFGEEGAPRFNMFSFRSLNGLPASPHSCATSCCFLGYAPDAFKGDTSFQEMMAAIPERYPRPLRDESPPDDRGVPHDVDMSTWRPVSDWVVGKAYWPSGESGSREKGLWHFLFSSGWPDDPEFAARRALKVLVDLPEGADIREEGWYESAYVYWHTSGWQDDPRWFTAGAIPVPVTGKDELKAALQAVADEPVGIQPS